MDERSGSPQWRRPLQPTRLNGDTHKIGFGSDSLPSMSFAHSEKMGEVMEYEQPNPAVATINMPAPPLVSPSSIHSGPPPPYSYPSSSASSVQGISGYISPPASRRTSDDDKEPHRSLPSIHEALGKDKALLFNPPPPPPPPLPSQHHSMAPTSHPATTLVSPPPRSHPDTLLSGPPNPFAPMQQAPSFNYEPNERRSQPPQSTCSAMEDVLPRSSLFAAQEPFSHPTHMMTTRSPSPTMRPSPLLVQQPQRQSPIFAHAPSTPGVVSTQPPFHPFQQAYSFPPPSTGTSAFPANGVSSFQPPFAAQPAWRSDGSEIDRADEMRKAAAKRSPLHYGESVKRHLDIFDLETSLNEIVDGSGRALDFARHYCARAHHTQRSGPLPGSFPSLTECDDMIRRQTRILDSMSRIKEVIITQQHAVAEQRSRDEANRIQGEYREETSAYADKMDVMGGFAGADPKKRRGRNAPPGRCHSCNRAETPEWRRGPDGARTLCNACGLHYAKLTRKMGPKGSSSIGSSNLRPKESGSGTP